MNSFKLKLAAAAVVLGGFASGANASDGSVHFTGEIIAKACTVDSGGTPIEVPLGKVAASSLSVAGTKSTSHPFDIKLTGCEDSDANVRFDGTPDADKPHLLKLGGSSVAKGVAIEINTINDDNVAMYDKSPDIHLNAGPNTLHYLARYVATGPTVVVGKAEATTQFTIIYK